jgi:glycerol-3-phosphate dehydrogenase
VPEPAHVPPRAPAACDLLVVGGGIHGAGVARDAAGRGLSVVLCEQGDLAVATSSASSKLIHGGLRYLEHLELGLVRESLSEREVLLRTAPHLVRPLTFVLPVGPGSRPSWQLRIGLFLYDQLGAGRTLPGSRALSLPDTAFGEPLRPELDRGFLYSDCHSDDSRLVVANARAAAALGATVLPRTAAVGARRDAGRWRVMLERAGRRTEVVARGVINAAGPWVSQVLTGLAGLPPRHGLRLIKGSHIVVPRLYEGEHAYTLQQPDKRVVFVIPYERDFTLIGTTDVTQEQPGPVALSPEEAEYLCAACNGFLRRPVEPSDVVWSFAGTRSLADDGSANPSKVTRHDVLDLDADGAPLLSVYGGKLTTYRRMAERMLAKILPALPAPNGSWRGPWTAGAALPGGELPVAPGAGLHEGAAAGARLQAFTEQLAREHPGLPADWLAALALRHGSDCAALLAGARTTADLGRDFGGGLHERELRWMIEREWAEEADDVLWRRSKLGLRLDPAQRQAVADWMAATRATR